MNPQPQVKSGLKTTEFYFSLLSFIVGLLVMLGYVTPEQATTLTEQGKVFIESLTMAFGAILAIVPIVTYIASRIWLKAQTTPSGTLPVTVTTGAPGNAQPTVPGAASSPSAKPSYIVN